MASAEEISHWRVSGDHLPASLQQAWAQGDQELVVKNGAAAEVLKAPGLRVYWVGVAADASK